MRFRVLGPLEVAAGDGPVAVTSAKQRELLTLLLLNAGRVLSTDFIIDELWGEAPPSGGVKTLRYHVSELRRVVRDAAGEELPLETRPNGYVLSVGSDQVDAMRFEQLCERAREHRQRDPAAAKGLLDEALGLWRGRPLAGEEEFLAFAQGEIRRLDALRLGGLIDRSELMLALGDHDAALPQLEQLVGNYPTNERLHGLLMLALYRAGRQSDALATYRALRERLVEAKGIDPSPELRRLEEQILVHDPDLAAGAAHWAIPGVRHLPAGTVTFLFTDIEGSTRRWSEDPEHMKAVLAAHDTALADAVGAHHGVVFKHTGDGMGAVFANPHDAIDAAVGALLALGTDADPPLVRIAVHTGTAEPAGGDYFGLPVSMCARIADVGHGGQILVSSATAGLVEATDPVELRPLGRHRLRDIPNPEPLFQVRHPVLRTDFPPLLSLEHPDSNLPEPLTDIVGRSRDLDHLDELLATRRVVTLLGAGGIGKTRLALAAAGQRRFATRDGVRLVELASVDPEAVPAAVAHALGVQPRSELGVEESLLDWMRPRELLLVLDNCEHVAAAAASLVGLVAAGTREVVVLATSRQPLGVPGEVSYPVQPLATPPDDASPATLERAPATELFVARARSARHGFEIGAANAAAIAEICRRLDGVPLAIELAAARVATIGVTEVAAHLDSRLRLLSITGGEPRHRSLEAAFGWSYDLLSPAEQRMFDRLAPAPAWFAMQSAAEVADLGGDEDPVALVSSLVERSMLVVEEDQGGTWFRMLGPLRDFGLARLQARGEAEEATARHAEHYASLATEAGEGIRTERESAWARQVDRSFASVRAAFRWATGAGATGMAASIVVALWSYALQRLRTEVFDWAAQLAGDDAVGSMQQGPEVLGAAAIGAWLRGDLAGAVAHIGAALAAEERLGSGPTIPARVALINTAGYAAGLEDADQQAAVLGALPERFLELVAACRATGDPYWLVHSLVIGSFGRSLARDGDGAEKLASKALVVAREAGNPTSLAWAHYGLGSARAEADPHRAAPEVEESLQWARRAGSLLIEGLAMSQLAVLRRRMGQPTAAMPVLLELLEYWGRAGNHAQQWHTLREAAMALAAAGDHRRGMILLGAVDSAPLVMPQLPGDEAALAEVRTELSAALGADLAGTVAAAGATLSREDAVELARVGLATVLASAP